MMAAYLIFELGEVADAAAIDEYIERGPAIVQQYEGRYLARGQQAEVVEGDHRSCGMVLIEFPSMARLKAFYDSPEYTPLRQLRQRAMTGNFLMLGGVERT